MYNSIDEYSYVCQSDLVKNMCQKLEDNYGCLLYTSAREGGHPQARHARRQLSAGAGGAPVSYTHLDVYKRQGTGGERAPVPDLRLRQISEQELQKPGVKPDLGGA